MKITIYFETLYLGESLSLRDEDVMEQFERIDKKQQEEIRPVLMVDADVKAKNTLEASEWSPDYLKQ